MGGRFAMAFAAASFVSKPSAGVLVPAARTLHDRLFERLAFDDSTSDDDQLFFPLDPKLRVHLLMAVRDVAKVEDRRSKRGKKMPPLDELHGIGLPVGLLAAILAELHEQLFGFHVAQPLDVRPRKQRMQAKFGSEEAIANKKRLVYFNEVLFVCWPIIC
jgi:hypothetical protein